MRDVNPSAFRQILEQRDFENKTALHTAIVEKNDTGNAVEALLSLGADPQ